MVDLAGVGLVGVLATHDVDGEFEFTELDEAEVDREDGRGEDQPGHDPRERDAPDGDLSEDETGQSVGDGLEDAVDVLLDGTEEALLGREDLGSRVSRVGRWT